VREGEKARKIGIVNVIKRNRNVPEKKLRQKESRNAERAKLSGAILPREKMMGGEIAEGSVARRGREKARNRESR